MKKVLIADDSVFTRALLKGILAKNGFSVVGEAADGAEAIAKYKKLKPDVVMLDISMTPVENLTSFEVMKELTPVCKVVAISSFEHKKTIKEAFDLGAIETIRKPFEEKAVLEILRKV